MVIRQRRSSGRFLLVLVCVAASSFGGGAAWAAETLISMDFESGESGFPEQPGLSVVTDAERGGKLLRVDSGGAPRFQASGPSRRVPAGATVILEFDIGVVPKSETTS